VSEIDNWTSRILVVEDDDTVREIQSAVLQGAGFAVDMASTLKEARQRWTSARYDVVLLDLSLPDGNGLSAIPEIRDRTTAGVMVLTSSHRESERLAGLESGADDYLHKPIHPRELIARVRNLVKRLQASRAPTESAVRFEFEGWTLDVLARQIHFGNGKREHLTESEFRILEVLAKNPGNPVHRERLLAKLDSNDAVTPRAVDKTMYRLRTKMHAHLGHKAKLIETVHGFGYRLDAMRL